MKTMHVVISGLVQGVGFRYFATQKARALGVRGWVRNLTTGEVEIVAQAEEAVLDALVRDLRVGPRSAHVSDLRIVWQDDAEMYDHFDIRA
jgi:acylphosphatase